MALAKIPPLPMRSLQPWPDHVPLYGYASEVQRWNSKNACLSETQDSARATVTPCAIPYIACLPVAIVALIAAKYVLAQRKWERYRPAWTRPFVREDDFLSAVEIEGLALESRVNCWVSCRVIVLCALSVSGVLTELIHFAGGLEDQNWVNVPLCVAWVRLTSAFP